MEAHILGIHSATLKAFLNTSNMSNGLFSARQFKIVTKFDGPSKTKLVDAIVSSKDEDIAK
jgi:hypothetical protein